MLIYIQSLSNHLGYFIINKCKFCFYFVWFIWISPLLWFYILMCCYQEPTEIINFPSVEIKSVNNFKNYLVFYKFKQDHFRANDQIHCLAWMLLDHVWFYFINRNILIFYSSALSWYSLKHLKYCFQFKFFYISYTEIFLYWVKTIYFNTWIYFQWNIIVLIQ
jgi:hypothetical protein